MPATPTTPRSGEMQFSGIRHDLSNGPVRRVRFTAGNAGDRYKPLEHAASVEAQIDKIRVLGVPFWSFCFSCEAIVDMRLCYAIGGDILCNACDSEGSGGRLHSTAPTALSNVISVLTVAEMIYRTRSAPTVGITAETLRAVADKMAPTRRARVVQVVRVWTGHSVWALRLLFSAMQVVGNVVYGLVVAYIVLFIVVTLLG